MNTHAFRIDDFDWELATSLEFSTEWTFICDQFYFIPLGPNVYSDSQMFTQILC